MKLRSGKRIGQSGYELTLAVFFSFFLHAAVVIAALFLYMAVAPKALLPPRYDVKLVGLPADSTPTPLATPAPVPPTPAPMPVPKKVEPKAKKSMSKRTSAKTAPKRIALPEFSQAKPKPSQPEEPHPGPAASVQPSSPAAQEKPAVKTEGAAVDVPMAGMQQQGFNDTFYIGRVKDKISRNWRPPPDAPDAKARVVFSINRSGWLGDVHLDEEHSKGTFGFKQAAIRAIRLSNQFPSLPEEFSKQTLEFIVDLTAEN